MQMRTNLKPKESGKYLYLHKKYEYIAKNSHLVEDGNPVSKKYFIFWVGIGLDALISIFR